MTDSDSDISYKFVDENDVQMVYMPYVVDGVEYLDDLGPRRHPEGLFPENARRAPRQKPRCCRFRRTLKFSSRT